MTRVQEKPKPVLIAEYCKACGRCIEACAQHCIEMGTEINPATGLVPVTFHLENCTACGKCYTVCPDTAIPGLVTEVGAALDTVARRVRRGQHNNFFGRGHGPLLPRDRAMPAIQ